jgi:hypothetical protein
MFDAVATHEEEALLDAVPAFLGVSDMLKATPREEGGVRFVYLEASNEAVDYQGEVVLAKALADSADYYLRYGNLDLDHFTQIGAKQGIPNYELYEIGRPVDVRARDGKTFVKGQVYSGTGPAAERANGFWSSLVDLNPPARWYPSVGGKVITKSVAIDPVSKAKRAIISQVRWTNIGFSKTPVNLSVGPISTVPIGVLAKSMCAGGIDYAKALEAGYGTDAAALSGGAALRSQSLQQGVLSYWDFRDSLAGLIRSGKVNGGRPSDLVKVAHEQLGVKSADQAARYVQRFLADLEQHRSGKQ